MAKEITWKCTYCDSMNEYNESNCVNCGAPRSADTQFVTIPSDKEEKNTDASDMLAAAAAFTVMSSSMSAFGRIARTLRSIKRIVLGAAVTGIIILILFIILNLVK